MWLLFCSFSFLFFFFFPSVLSHLPSLCLFFSFSLSVSSFLGFCYELNNRAKHEVYNGGDQWRVHLIFDWIDAMPPTASSKEVAKEDFMELEEEKEKEKEQEQEDKDTNIRLVVVPPHHSFRQTRRCLSLVGPPGSEPTSSTSTSSSSMQYSRGSEPEQLEQSAVELWNVRVIFLVHLSQTATNIFIRPFDNIFFSFLFSSFPFSSFLWHRLEMIDPDYGAIVLFFFSFFFIFFYFFFFDDIL